MQNFHYLAIDAFGQQQEGTLAARDLDDAARILREERGWTVRDLQAIDDEVAPKKPATSAREQEALAGMLAGLTEGQLPLSSGLRMLGAELAHHNPWLSKRMQQRLEGMATLLEQGSSLEESLKMQGAPADLIAAVEAGVRSGNPGQALSQYVAYLKGSSSLRLQLILGILYPLFLFVTSGFLFLGLMLLIVPGFNNIFQGFGIELPFLTVSVLNFSSFLVNYGKLLCWLVLGLLALYGCLLCFLPEYYRRVLLHAIPVVGPISEAVSMARFTHTLGFLTDNEVLLPEALRLAGESAGDLVIRRTTRRWAECLEAGESLKQSAARLRGIPAELIETLAWHADPRFFSQALHGLGTMYENRARMRISLLIAVSEPIIVVTIGLIFLFAVVGLFLPLLRLMNDLS